MKMTFKLNLKKLRQVKLRTFSLVLLLINSRALTGYEKRAAFSERIHNFSQKWSADGAQSLYFSIVPIVSSGCDVLLH